MSKQDGGPAFPQPTEYDQHGQFLNYASRGISIRDYFASAALQGMYPLEPAQSLTREDYAMEAYRMADAMLAAREAK